MKVLAYNIRGASADPRAVGRLVRDAGVDVACLNEVRRGTGRVIARAARMHLAVDRPWSRYRNALLLAERPRWVRRTRLSPTRGRPRRGCVAAALNTVTVAVTHLGLDAGERARHAREVRDFVEHMSPLVLCGDLNERPGGTVHGTLLAGLRDAFEVAGRGRGETFPADRPTARIDYVLCSDGIRVVSCEVLDAAESDHRPVLAELGVTPTTSSGG